MVWCNVFVISRSPVRFWSSAPEKLCPQVSDFPACTIYKYDQVGNRNTSTTPTDWTYKANNELQSYNVVTYQYDQSGTEIKTYGFRPNATWSTDPLFMKQGKII